MKQGSTTTEQGCHAPETPAALLRLLDPTAKGQEGTWKLQPLCSGYWTPPQRGKRAHGNSSRSAPATGPHRKGARGHMETPAALLRLLDPTARGQEGRSKLRPLCSGYWTPPQRGKRAHGNSSRSAPRTATHEQRPQLHATQPTHHELRPCTQRGWGSKIPSRSADRMIPHLFY